MIGPDGEFYITDRHHFSTAIYKSKGKKWSGKKQKLVLKVIATFQGSGISSAEFWTYMEQSNYVWPYDENDQKVSNYGPKLAAMNMGDLQDDAYRTLSKWIREGCGYLKQGEQQCVKVSDSQSEPKAPFFMEFYWAKYLRKQIKVMQTSANYLQNLYPEAMLAVLDINKTSHFFSSLALNVNDYGQNRSGNSIPVSFNQHGCAINAE